jgi:hypothetical protein
LLMWMRTSIKAGDENEDEDTHAHLMEKGEKRGAAIANTRNENAVAVTAGIVS